MRYLFISDLHLQPERPDITRAFLHCLDTRAREADELYILGDFFEVWLGDDEQSPLANEVINALAKLSGTGTRIYVMHGNRDFLLGRRFCRAAGCTLLPDPHIVQINGEQVLLMHGDSLCTDDLAYMKMRRLLRNPVSLFVLRNLSLAQRRKIGRKLRNESREQTRQKPSDITDVNLGQVAETMRRHGVRTLIHGHTHRPAIHQLVIDGKPAQRIVLGDWDTAGWCLKVDENGYRLESFPLT
ncbi:UDP-2,3-diacylglucosamine diphosphatase [Halopseudomonas salina]|uniref:UDP-2,3-diacylglucosamine hydrolase n=1 Tax=Halopseudomonas salina TaxID=1323744 RepID=A0ABQ1PTY1_9GAMM|nr:UDP-2,3-diacylglucosamine diphosphatase [Halopseudomonas salina]GGD03442.1 UDP-2,3-diacylglucosamine hydrolase [Halopseudomonas salina]